MYITQKCHEYISLRNFPNDHFQNDRFLNRTAASQNTPISKMFILKSVDPHYGAFPKYYEDIHD